jgi:hypothetical protein
MTRVARMAPFTLSLGFDVAANCAVRANCVARTTDVAVYETINLIVAFGYQITCDVEAHIDDGAWWQTVRGTADLSSLRPTKQRPHRSGPVQTIQPLRSTSRLL